MSRSTKEYRPPIAERVVRHGGSLDDRGVAPSLRSPEDEAVTRSSRYKRVAALFEDWQGQDDDAPELESIEPLRLQSPAL